jgi:hypothetical protein
MSSTTATIRALARSASGRNLGFAPRKSDGSKSGVVMVPVRKPRPSGAKGTNDAPFFAHQSTMDIPASVSSASGSLVQIDSSDWTAVTGWAACARAASAAVTSESPSHRTLPAWTSSAIAPHVSSSGTAGSTRCR